jgi:hypothetical protein
LNNFILNGLEGDHPLNTDSQPTREAGFCGDIDMRITRDGIWHYRGTPINRMKMVKLFSSVLKRDETGDFWLETPVEKCRIQVDDAPFIAVDLTVSGSGRHQKISFRTNLDENVIAGRDHPIWFVHDPVTKTPSPYVFVRDGLEALISRAVFYDLMDRAVEENIEDGTRLCLWSDGELFELGVIDNNEI